MSTKRPLEFTYIVKVCNERARIAKDTLAEVSELGRSAYSAGAAGMFQVIKVYLLGPESWGTGGKLFALERQE